MKHTAAHPLPICRSYNERSDLNSDGGSIPRMPTTYCGRCGGSFDVDQDWVDRYFAKEVTASERRHFEALGFTLPPLMPLADVSYEDPEIASPANFQCSNPMVAFMCIRDGELKVLTYQAARTLKAHGQAVYGAWRGQRATEILVIDDLG